MFGLTKQELKILKKLNSPIKIQNFLDTLSMNHEKNGETYKSPRRVLKDRSAHCLEGAMLASLCLWIQGERPLILDLKSDTGDDHTVALYKINGYWGAISKTNHATLRFRDPVYKTIRELALSYFHEYFDLKNGRKILESYSDPFDMKKFDSKWITTDEELFDLAEALDDSKHYRFYPPKNKKFLRKADKMEMKAGNLLEWPN
jgi:hypothetical protein